jgi:uncharacterized protein (TIGR03437 family)
VHKLSAQLLTVTLSVVVSTFAQPVISSQSAVSSASYRKPGLPGSGIAQGSIFSIFGTGLGPDTFEYANSFPLPDALAGTSVNITIGDKPTPAIILFANKAQVNAILPSTTPIGTGTVTVTYNNQTSAPAPIQVVASAFGMYTYGSSGSGQAMATDTNYQPNTIIHTFHPGDYVLLWGTGLGPINSSDRVAPSAGDLPGTVTVHVGNVTAPVKYHGRAPCCAGLDQIVFQVPAAVQGCYVPVAVETAGGIANMATIAVSASGQTCSDSVLGQDLVQKLASGQKVGFGYVRLESYITQGQGQSGADYALATFSELDPKAAGMAQYGVSNGYCYAVDCSLGCAANGGTFSGSLSDSSPAQLDAGSLAVVNGSSIPLNQYGGFYAAPMYDVNGGRFLWSNLAYAVTGTGGKNVGALTMSDTTSKLTLKFSNLATNQALSRASDLQLQWTGGDPALQNGQVTIGALSTTTDFSQFEVVQCTAPLSAKQFTVPAWVLSALPPSGPYVVGGVTYPLGFVWIGQYNKPVGFSAPGLDRGIISDIFYYRQEVNFQ